MAKHTPGPWVAVKPEKPKTPYGWEVTAPTLETFPQTVARMGFPGSHSSAIEANARLIAKAPDMLDAINAALVAINGAEIVIAQFNGFQLKPEHQRRVDRLGDVYRQLYDLREQIEGVEKPARKGD